MACEFDIPHKPHYYDDEKWCPGKVDVRAYDESLELEPHRATLRDERNSTFLREQVVNELAKQNGGLNGNSDRG